MSQGFITKEFSKPLAWELSYKFLKMLMDGGKLTNNYEEKLKIIEDELEKYGDKALKEFILGRLNEVIKKYQKTGIWDFVLLGK